MADARERLVAELREHALVIGEVTLTSGANAQYLVDAKRAILLPGGLPCARRARRRRGARDVGATRGRRADDGRRPDRLRGARRRAPTSRRSSCARRSSSTACRAGSRARCSTPDDRCLIVEDVVTTGGSTLKAIERVRDDGHQIVGVVAILDRLAGGGEAIEAAIGDAPYVALTTIDDVYPERPD